MSLLVSTYTAAARAVRDTVAAIPDHAWDQPGLGEWTVRDLVGHTSRSLVTVVDYLERPVPEEVVTSAAAYLVAISDGSFDAAAVTERGREAGRALGEDPAARFHELVDAAAHAAEETDPDRIVHTIVGGMRVRSYLPTRTFELCVHGLDLAAATGLPVNLPAPALEEALTLGALAAAQRGVGRDLLMALTGRAGLRSGFSVV